jgi:hypothetical protein
VFSAKFISACPALLNTSQNGGVFGGISLHETKKKMHQTIFPMPSFAEIPSKQKKMYHTKND